MQEILLHYFCGFVCFWPAIYTVCPLFILSNICPGGLQFSAFKSKAVLQTSVLLVHQEGQKGFLNNVWHLALCIHRSIIITIIILFLYNKKLLAWGSFAQPPQFAGISDGNGYHCIYYHSPLHNIKDQCILPVLVSAFEHLQGATVYHDC